MLVTRPRRAAMSRLKAPSVKRRHRIAADLFIRTGGVDLLGRNVRGSFVTPCGYGVLPKPSIRWLTTEDPMEVSRERLGLNEGENPLSPPIVLEPLYRCATAVVIVGFVPHAALDVEIDGAVSVAGVPGGFPEPQGALIIVPALTADQVVRARQHVGGRMSDWSAPVTVRDHFKDYPAGPPRPQINPTPVHECGARTGVANLLIGCDVWITADGVEVGKVKGANKHQGVNVNPDYGPGQQVRAHAELCGAPAPPSESQIPHPPPNPMPTPGFEPPYAGGAQLVVTNLA